LGNPDLAPREELVNPDLAWLADLEERDFERLFNGSPIRRAGFLGLRRNIAIAMGNSGLTRFLPWLNRWSQIETQGSSCVDSVAAVQDPARAAVRSAARWAVRRIAPVVPFSRPGSLEND
jgi:epoxyqueuosine reductase